MTKILKIVLFATPLLLLSANAYAAQWITDLQAFKGRQECSEHYRSTDWKDWGYDGSANITYCMKTTNSKPVKAVIDIVGINPGNVSCASSKGSGWEDFAYDGNADIRFCQKKAKLTDDVSYVTAVDAIQGKIECENVLDGKGWDKVIYNGAAGITFCARFR
ncbi:MAG: hypothetical protein ABJN40_13425 [Sneathiella sp.]